MRKTKVATSRVRNGHDRKARALLPAACALAITAAAIEAHHSPAGFFDTETAVTVTGTIVRFDRANPHIYLEQTTAEGPVEWAIEAPAPVLLEQRAAGQVLLSPGDTVEACGYALKSGLAAGRAARDEKSRVLVAEIVETADGRARLWSDYGNHRCRDLNRYDISGP